MTRWARLSFCCMFTAGSLLAEDSAVDRIEKGSHLLQAGNISAAIQMFQSVLDPGRPVTVSELAEATTRYHLGWAYEVLDQDKQAQAEYLKAEAILTPRTEFHYPHLMRLLESEASLKAKRRQFSSARALIDRAQSIVHQFAPDDRVEAANLSVEMGAIDQLDGKPNRAATYYRQALDIIEQSYGRRSTDWRRLANNLALLLLHSGKREEAAYYIGEALWQHEVFTGLDRLVAGKLLLTRFDVYLALGRKLDAQHDAEEALQIFDTELGSSNRLTAEALLRCEQACRALGHKAEARQYAKRAKESLDSSPSVLMERNTVSAGELAHLPVHYK